MEETLISQRQSISRLDHGLRGLLYRYQATNNKLIASTFIIKRLKDKLKEQENMMKHLRGKQKYLYYEKVKVKNEQELIENKYTVAAMTTELQCYEKDKEISHMKSSIEQYKSLEKTTRDENRYLSEKNHRKEEKIKDLKFTLSNLNNWNVR